MTIKNNVRFEKKLTLGSKNDMRNLVNFHPWKFAITLFVCKQNSSVKWPTLYAVLKSRIFKILFSYIREPIDKFSHLLDCAFKSETKLF